MKKSFLAGLAAALCLGASLAFAADPAPAPAPTVTIVGEGQCAKCSLGKSDVCQNVVVVTKDGKEQIYYLAANALSDKFHDNVCTETKPVKVVGVLKETDGKKEITATSIELVKK
ncbi:MAG TPA: DUF6370 family protein [Opitutaceae bacterium]|nr:DUF6370 family protein [Opitutaceae bacterium]